MQLTEFLLEIADDGSTLEINDSGDQLLILDSESSQGGSSGGRVKKRIGKSLADQQIGKRPSTESRAVSSARIIAQSRARSTSRILIEKSTGTSVFKLQVQSRARSTSRIGRPAPRTIHTVQKGTSTANVINTQTVNERLSRLKKLIMLRDIIDRL